MKTLIILTLLMVSIGCRGEEEKIIIQPHLTADQADSCFYMSWWDSNGKLQGQRIHDRLYRQIMVVDTVGWIIHAYGDSLCWQQNRLHRNSVHTLEYEIYRVSYCRKYGIDPRIDTTYYFINNYGDTVKVVK